MHAIVFDIQMWLFLQIQYSLLKDDTMDTGQFVQGSFAGEEIMVYNECGDTIYFT